MQNNSFSNFLNYETLLNYYHLTNEQKIKAKTWFKFCNFSVMQREIYDYSVYKPHAEEKKAACYPKIQINHCLTQLTVISAKEKFNLKKSLKLPYFWKEGAMNLLSQDKEQVLNCVSRFNCSQYFYNLDS